MWYCLCVSARMFGHVVVGCKSIHDLRGFNSDAQDHVTTNHVLDGGSGSSTQPYHTCTLPYGHASARVPAYAAGARRHADQRCVYESPTEHRRKKTNAKSPPRWLLRCVIHNDKTLVDFCPDLRQILADFQNSFTGTLGSKFAMKSLLKHSTTPWSCSYTTLWNFCVQKLPWLMTESSELRCKTQPLNRVVAKYFLLWYLLTVKSKIICVVT